MGTIRGNLLQARGSYYGATWIFDVERAEIVAGPFRKLEENSRIWTIKHAPGPDEPARAVALGEWHGRVVAAIGHLRQAEVFDLENGDRIGSTRTGSSDTVAVALAESEGRALLATGSDGGTVTLWEGPSMKELASITLDVGVRDLWLASNVLAVRGGDDRFHVFDLVPVSRGPTRR